MYGSVRIKFAQYEHMAGYSIDVHDDTILPWIETITQHMMPYLIDNNLVSSLIYEFQLAMDTYMIGDSVLKKKAVAVLPSAWDIMVSLTLMTYVL